MSIAVVASALASKPRNGGFAWVPLSFTAGLSRLGYDVYLLEQIDGAVPAGVAFFTEVVEGFGLAGRSALITSGGETIHGLDAVSVRDVVRDAELLVNISGNARLEWIVEGPRLSAYVDTDPGFTQIWHRDGLLHVSIRNHTHHFSVGANIGRGSAIPADGLDWRPLPPPVVLEQWPLAPCDARSRFAFSTVAAWRCPSGVLSLDGFTFPAKHHEFRRVLGMPSAVPGAGFEIALDIDPADAADRHALELTGWTVRDPRSVAAEPLAFRDYVVGSAAEFSMAQGVYALAGTGWFSDRSVRYLATGRPVLVQETGLRGPLASGDGVVTFGTLDEARRGAERIMGDYSCHAAAARHLAETVFDSDRVLGDMLDQVGARA